MNVDINDNNQYLCIVEYAQEEHSSHTKKFARLRPCLVRVEDDWKKTSNQLRRFPDEGLVFWWHPPDECVEGTAWIVTITAQPQYDGDKKLDRFQVDPHGNHLRPYEEITLLGVSNNTQLRRLISSGSLLLNQRPLGLPLVKMPGNAGNRWLGPLRGEIRTRQGGGVVLSVDIDSGFLEVQSIEPEHVQTIECLGECRQFVRPCGMSLSTAALFNTQSDEELFQSLLKRARRLDKKVVDALGVTRKIYERYVDTLLKAQLGDEDGLREDARESAVKDLLQRIDADVEFRQRLLDSVLEHPDIKARIEQHIHSLAENERERIEEIVDADIADRREKLKELDKKIKALAESQQEKVEEMLVLKTAERQQQLRNVEKKLQQLTRNREDMDREVDKVMSSIEVGVENAINNAAEKIVEDAILRKVMASLFVDGHGEESVDYREESKEGSHVEISVLSGKKELVERIGRSAMAAGIDPQVLQICLAALAGSRVILLSGAQADTSASALANVLAADRSVRVSVGATIFGISDLLNMPIARERVYGKPIGNTLGEFLEASDNEGEICVVILQGCNRAPVENTLLDFIEASSVRNGVKREIAWVARDRKIHRIKVDRRTLVIGVLTTGDGVYHVPDNIAWRVPLVPIDRQIVKLPQVINRGGYKSSMVNRDFWDKFTSSSKELESLVRREMSFNLSRMGGCEYLAGMLGMFEEIIGRHDTSLVEMLISLLGGRESGERIRDIAKYLGEDAGKMFLELAESDVYKGLGVYFQGANAG